jgi:hypothetical protein
VHCVGLCCIIVHCVGLCCIIVHCVGLCCIIVHCVGLCCIITGVCIRLSIKRENISVRYCISTRDRYSAVGIATRYGLDHSGIEYRWGRDIPHPFRPALGAHPYSYAMETEFLPRCKAAGAWR